LRGCSAVVAAAPEVAARATLAGTDVVEGAVGDEDAAMDIPPQRRAKALHEGDGAAGRIAQPTPSLATTR
jgi:hypothetical protein